MSTTTSTTALNTADGPDTMPGTVVRGGESSIAATADPTARTVPGLPNVRLRDAIDVTAVVVTLAVINLIANLTSLSSAIATVPVGVACLLAMAKARGMTLTDLGLGRGTRRTGLFYGLGAAALVLGVVGIAVAIPLTREFFFNEAYSSLRTALVAALILIPLQTVLPEELAFRGVLHGTLRRIGGTKTVFIGGSLLFGLWHVASSLSLTASNVGLTAMLGSGSAAQWAGVGLAVIATAGAGCGLTWLRHHTNSVFAPIGLHWALNAVGALAAAAAWHFL